MSAYFEKILSIGDLNLEYVFYEYEEPVLFVCTDALENRYLCSCCRLGENWIVGRITDSALVDVIDGTETLEGAFRKSSFVFFLVWDGERLDCHLEIPEDAYPRAGAALKLLGQEKAAVADYRAKLVPTQSDSVVRVRLDPALYSPLLYHQDFGDAFSVSREMPLSESVTSAKWDSAVYAPLTLQIQSCIPGVSEEKRMPHSPSLRQQNYGNAFNISQEVPLKVLLLESEESPYAGLEEFPIAA